MYLRHTKCIGTIARMWVPEFASEEFLNSWSDLRQFSQQALCGPDEFILPLHSTYSWHEGARNAFVSDMLGEWILMLDTDHVFTPDLLVRMLALRKKYGCRVLSGIYQYKFPPHAPVANLWTPEGGLVALTDWNRAAEVVEIGPCGGGCLLVDRSVLLELQYKFPGQQPFSVIPGLSEDYSFFKRCYDVGIKTYLAPRVQSHHLAKRGLYAIEDYLAWKDNKPE